MSTLAPDPAVQSSFAAQRRAPSVGAVVELLKPITWFPPMWAYACGAVSVGVSADRWIYVAAGVLLAGPMVCGTSQAVNDWFDRHVDAINEPDRVIPSGRMPGRWGLWVAVAGTLISAAFAALLGFWVFVAAAIGLAMAWAYSAPPIRLKMNGWLGNGAVGFSYESLPWITAGAAAMGGLPPTAVLLVALAYGLGAHGILTLNDFKAMEGDREMGVATLPLQLGARNAALLAALTMLIPQAAIATWLLASDAMISGGVVAAATLAQAIAARRLVADPVRNAVWFSAAGVGLYVTGMMATAISLGSTGGA
ncbi:MAG: chlorophyll synthase ChlG [Pseudomonadota bacterium]